MKKPKKPIICQLDVSELNWYAHDYELPAEAEVHLHAAHKLLADGHPGEALEEIAEARAKLTKYLSQDNMILEDDTANPWVRFGDILNNLDLVIL